MDFKGYLQNDVLDFWLRRAIDEEEGGIFTCLDRKGEVYGTEKSVWFQGRALYTFSKAYNVIDKNDKYLRAAKKIYDFLPKCTDSDGRMFFTVTRLGEPIQKRRYYFSETFAAIGCAEYYRATGNAEALARAERYFEVARSCFEDPSRNTPKYYTRAKALSPVMIMLSTARTMAACSPEPVKYEAFAKSCLNEILHGGYISDEVSAMLESVSSDGEFVNTPSGRTVNPGHSLEAAWFIMVEGLLGNNSEALSAAKKIIDMTMPLGLDRKHGGIIAFTDALGKPATALEWDMKLWWPQNEAIIANRMAYEIFGEEKYREQYESLLDYAFANFADREHGEWYGYLHYDNTPSSELKGNIFKGPFHLPRMLMLLQLTDKGRMLDFFR
ncbi:MAG: AGE family epimerase/isomerase [Clostridia bacterium]|nr:AGE family epimerase/isomerase [Clostridia bacterium]